ncbi:hypothetical protein JCM11251_007673 [Rhodosporidiobolus azoricus]
MIIDRGCERGVSWSAASVYGQHDSAEQDTDEEDVEKVSVVKAKKAILLVERLRPKEVAIISVSNPLMSHLRYTGTRTLFFRPMEEPLAHTLSPRQVLLFNCDPSLDTVSFQHLTRLGLYSLDIVGQKPFLSPVHFPNLVTLAVKGTITMSRARSYDNNLGPLRWSIDHIPVLPQLKAVSEWYNDGDSPLAVTVLDTWCAGEAVQYPERISSTVQVLRLTHGGMSEPSEYTPLLRLLTSPSFTANLVELHLLYFDRDPGQGLSATKAWCEAHNVKLYTSNPDDLMDPFDFSFWRFLDGVKDRLGLKSNLDISRRGSGQGTA